MSGRLREKVKPLSELRSLLTQQQKAGARVVLTNGCFDLLHIGHIRYLESARSLGDILVVAVNSDRSVRLLRKGPGRPIVPDTQRAEVVAALAMVDYVVVFDEPNPLQVIAALQPDVLVKGGDWPPDQIIGRDLVEAKGGAVHALPCVPGVSTSHLIERILHSSTQDASLRDTAHHTRDHSGSGTVDVSRHG
ncbi:MAG: D-glycero-beta-D-manno-heptose 1-phosphate adenylyltransferase [Nitrospirae bacterium]|nr:MAG: D-glycero-beta-D-manno-heptose 1-phosphate adenylyltransferase [Nitrospirota bacterium]